MPDETCTRHTLLLGEAVQTLADLKPRNLRGCTFDIVPVGWRRTGHIWVPCHARIQDFAGPKATDTPERLGGR